MEKGSRPRHHHHHHHPAACAGAIYSNGQGHAVPWKTMHFHRAGYGVLFRVSHSRMVWCTTHHTYTHTRFRTHARSCGFGSNLSGAASTADRQRDTVGTRDDTTGGETCTIKGSEKHSKYHGIIIIRSFISQKQGKESWEVGSQLIIISQEMSHHIARRGGKRILQLSNYCYTSI